MRSTPGAQASRILVSLLACLLLGGECDPPKPDPCYHPDLGDITYLDPNCANPSSFAERVLFTPVYVAPFSSGFIAGFEIRASTRHVVQAFELDLHWNVGHAVLIDTVRHVEFDDDGELFSEGVSNPQAGTKKGIADLRHGDSGASGDFGIALVTFVSAGEPIVARLTGKLVGASGNVLPVLVNVQRTVKAP